MRGRRSLFLFVGFVCLVFAAGCGREKQVGEFSTYVNDFETAARTAGRPMLVNNIVIEFAEPSRTSIIAECITESLHTPRVQISPTRWRTMSEQNRQLTVFHELGHCVLKRGHRADLRDDGSPASIMNPYNVSESMYEDNKDYYLHELFNWTR